MHTEDIRRIAAEVIREDDLACELVDVQQVRDQWIVAVRRSSGTIATRYVHADHPGALQSTIRAWLTSRHSE